MKKESSMYVAALALLFSVFAICMCLYCCFGKKGNIVEETLMDRPEIIVNAMQGYEAKMREKAMESTQKMIDENINDINNNPASPILGNAGGKITLVEFFDYSCGYCHRLAPVLKNIIKNNPNVKVVTKEVAFVAPVSEYAAKAALAANEQGKYVEMNGMLIGYNGQLSESKVDEIAAKVGLDVEKYKADLKSDKIAKILQDNMELASKVQINGVPTLILEGKMLQTIEEEVIQQAIDAVK